MLRRATITFLLVQVLQRRWLVQKDVSAVNVMVTYGRGYEGVEGTQERKRNAVCKGFGRRFTSYILSIQLHPLPVLSQPAGGAVILP